MKKSIITSIVSIAAMSAIALGCFAGCAQKEPEVVETEPPKSVAAGTLDRDGDAIQVTVELTDGWSAEFAYGCVYIYENGDISEDCTAMAITLSEGV